MGWELDRLNGERERWQAERETATAALRARVAALEAALRDMCDMADSVAWVRLVGRDMVAAHAITAKARAVLAGKEVA